MNGKIIIGGVVVLLCLIGGIFLWQKVSEPTQLPAQPTKELKLSDFPEAFKEKTVIVLGDNASEIERQAAEEIKNFLLENNSSYIKVIDSQKIESFKKGYDLVIIGTPKTNPLLEEVYAMTNATRVTEEFPGEGKGVLEILPNPWDESKAMLLVEGSDEWGVKAIVTSLMKNKFIELNQKTFIMKDFKVEIKDLIENSQIYDGHIVIIEGNATEVKIYKSPPWLSFFLEEEGTKVFVRGTSDWVLIRITPQSLQELETFLTNYRILVKGVFYATDQIKEESVVIAKQISIIQDGKHKLIWVSPMPFNDEEGG